METIHATCIAIDGIGVLLRGPPGAGKSDLALRLIDRGAVLVADDRVRLKSRNDRLIAQVPERVAGLLEVRGIGIVRMPYQPEAEIGLIVDLVAADAIHRLPVDRMLSLANIPVRHIDLAPFDASAPIKLHLAVRRIQADSAASPQRTGARR